MQIAPSLVLKILGNSYLEQNNTGAHIYLVPKILGHSYVFSAKRGFALQCFHSFVLDCLALLEG